MMHEVVRAAPAPRPRPGPGDTGAATQRPDAWFLGFSADYVVGVWMGYDDNTPLSGVTGGGLPAEIFHETMARVLSGLPSRPLPMARPARHVLRRLRAGRPAGARTAPARTGSFPRTAVRPTSSAIFAGQSGRRPRHSSPTSWSAR